MKAYPLPQPTPGDGGAEGLRAIPQRHPQTSRAKTVCLLLLALLCGWNLYVRTRFLSWPPSAVFDEAYYVRYSLSYQSHRYYSDLHPPLPKLILGIAGLSSLYRGDYPFGQKSNGPAPPFTNYRLPIARLRAVVAVVGTLLPIVLFFLMQALGATPWIALLPALWVSFENATIINSSFVLLDPFLVLGIFSSLLFYLKALETTSWAKATAWAVMTGLALSLAVGTKLTGLSAAGAILFDLIFRVSKEKTASQRLKYLHLLLWGSSVFFCGYCGSWAVHEIILSSKTLPHGLAFFPALFDRIVWLNYLMLRGHLSLGSSDALGSRWWQWLVGYRPLLFWQTPKLTLYFFPNLLLWTGSVVLSLFFLFLVGFAKISNVAIGSPDRGPRHWRLLISLILISFVPNLFISRVLYLYQFLPTLIALFLLNGVCLQYFGSIAALRLRREKAVYATAVLLPMIAFVLTLPFSHGMQGELASYLKSHMDHVMNWRLP